MLNTTVFDAFPNAIERDWQISKMAYSTITGNELDADSLRNIDVIIDEGSSSEPNASPSYANLYSDMLIYVRPDQMPTMNTAALVGDYVVKNTTTNTTYAIIDAGIGKNQETGKIEHIELKLRAIGVGSVKSEASE